MASLPINSAHNDLATVILRLEDYNSPKLSGSKLLPPLDLNSDGAQRRYNEARDLIVPVVASYDVLSTQLGKGSVYLQPENRKHIIVCAGFSHLWTSAQESITSYASSADRFDDQSKRNISQLEDELTLLAKMIHDKKNPSVDLNPIDMGEYRHVLSILQKAEKYVSIAARMERNSHQAL